MMKIIKYLSFFILFLSFSKVVYADQLANYSTNYYYRRSNSSTSYTTGFRPNSSVTINKVVSNGSLNNNYFSYITGFNNKIIANFSKGIEYFIRAEFVMTDVESYPYVSDSSNPQYGYGFRFHDYISRIKSNSKTTTSGVNLLDTSVSLKTSNCYEGLDDAEFCTFHIFVTYRIYVNNDISELEIGSYTTSDVSFGVWKHLYDSDVSIASIEYVANVDGKIIEQQQQMNQKLDDINSSITNDSPISMDKLGNTAGWLPAGPVDSILTLPLSLMNSLTTSFNGQSRPLNIDVPYINRQVEIPCLSTIFNQIEGLPNFWSWVGAIAGCLILYKYLLNLYAWVDNVLMLRLEMHEDFGGNSTNFGSV